MPNYLSNDWQCCLPAGNWVSNIRIRLASLTGASGTVRKRMSVVALAVPSQPGAASPSAGDSRRYNSGSVKIHHFELFDCLNLAIGLSIESKGFCRVTSNREVRKSVQHGQPFNPRSCWCFSTGSVAAVGSEKPALLKTQEQFPTNPGIGGGVDDLVRREMRAAPVGGARAFCNPKPKE